MVESRAKWAIDSWRAKPVEQMPVYPDLNALSDVERQLAGFPPLFLRVKPAS